MTTPSKHLTLDELDAIRTHEGPPAQQEHLESCDTCQRAFADVVTIAAALVAPPESLTIPTSVDDRILWLAKKQAAAIKRNQRSTSAGRWAIAASLILALGAAGLWRSLSSPSIQIARAPGIAGDVNGDGQVDILDAFALARTIENGSPTGMKLDVDGNGTVDRRDVDLIAQSAVALGTS